MSETVVTTECAEDREDNLQWGRYVDHVREHYGRTKRQSQPSWAEMTRRERLSVINQHSATP